MPLHPPARPWVDTLREDREAILLVRTPRLPEAYCRRARHRPAETITSCATFLSPRWLHDTKRIKLGTGTLNLANSHPVTVATTVAMLDHLLGGRFIMGISPGGLPSDMEAFENLGKDRGKMFLECINHVLALWAGEPPYDLKGEFWNISTAKTQIPDIGQGIMLKPCKQHRPCGDGGEPFSRG